MLDVGQVFNIPVGYWFKVLGGIGDKEGIGIDNYFNRQKLISI